MAQPTAGNALCLHLQRRYECGGGGNLNACNLREKITGNENFVLNGNTWTANISENNNIGYFKIQISDKNDVHLAGVVNFEECGKYSVRINISSNVGYIYVGFNGSTYDPKLKIDVSDLPRDVYVLDFSLDVLDSKHGQFTIFC